MKKKNGFTLIELLAIIVILAIIAVITVPIILNIIENSRRGAATDSAYGYKDAVNKWYVSKLQEDSNYRLNGNYNVSDGKLNNIEIPLSGDKPTGGNLHYTNNVLDGGCLTIGDYKVTFDSKGSVSSTEKGSCDSSNIVLSCADDEFLQEEYSYVVTDQGACQTYFENDSGCAGDEECLEQISNQISELCSGEEVDGLSLSDAIVNEYVNYSDVESFVTGELTASWCVPNIEKCYEYNNNGDGTSTITKYLCGAERIDGDTYITEGKVLDVNIPSGFTIKNGQLVVTTIGEYAFRDTLLSSVTIPNSVTTIGKGAFDYNKLTSVTIPDSVITIGDEAFLSNELTSVTIPNSVTTIGAGAFGGNQLTSITIPNSVTTIGKGAFDNNKLTNITIPNSVITIGENAFNYNKLTNVTIGNSVTTIGKNAFSDNELTSITIPNSVITIGEHAFFNNNLTNVTIGNSVTTIGKGAFGNNQLTSITIPNSVTTIDEYAFQSNDLTSVIIGNGVTTIGDYAFHKIISSSYGNGRSNPNLTTIYNNTGRSFNWKKIVRSSSSATFETGTITNSLGDVTVTTGYPSGN